MKVRAYTFKDAQATLSLFLDTVQSINARDYSDCQIKVWANPNKDLSQWNLSLLKNHSFVAQINSEIVGFIDISVSGYLDRLFVHKDYQGQGIASALYQKVIETIKYKKITTHSSISAKPFFLSKGFTVIKEQQVELQGVYLTNFVMEKLFSQV
ncbi:GNAT family N-acetyltransferase [Myroides sp. LJL116]